MYKEIAIIAPTASGKTQLSITLAHKLNAVILSLDSLSIYKDIDIVSAKPGKEERNGIVHFGINKVFPNEKFDVIEFIAEYNNAKEYAMENDKNLIIVGGTGFYLKSMIDGLSITPIITEDNKKIIKNELVDLNKIYKKLTSIDKKYMSNIASNDKYRIEKALGIYIQTSLSPTEYFDNNKPTPVIKNRKNLKIFEIETDVELLRERIKTRTNKMINNGLIDEIIALEEKYTRAPNCMNSIGIIETLDYIDGKIDKNKLSELITIHTSQLAKRQRTFNKGQFMNVIKDSLENIEKKILSTFEI